MVVEFQASVKQGYIVAVANSIHEVFTSLSSSLLMEFGFIEGLMFLSQYTEEKEKFAPDSIDWKVHSNLES